MSTYKIVLVGNSGSGKTALINRLLTGKFSKEYTPTTRTTITSLTFKTTCSEITFDVYDFSGAKEGFNCNQYLNAHGCISMFDVSKDEIEMSSQIKEVLEITGEIPVIICANKVELNSQHTHASDYDISVLSNSNCITPFLTLARILTECSKLEFTAYPYQF